MKHIYILLWVSLCLASCQNVNKEVEIIPLPQSVTFQNNHLHLEGEVNIFLADSSFFASSSYLEEQLKGCNLEFTYVEEEEYADFKFLVDHDMVDEAYQLDVSSQGITIKSNSRGAGAFYAIQSLLQLMPPEIYSRDAALIRTLELPTLKINDKPRFPYRGAMIDVARNFLPKEAVLRFIDLMAAYKLNRLHFHLTDDQGWRIEIKRYPKLTEIGGYRKQTQIGHSDYYYPRCFDGKEKRGYYTQEEIKEMVQYAADRFITIIPEIEMPGHASAALAAYPEYSCGLGKEYVVRDYFDIFDEVYCPKEQTFTFLENVLSEVIDLFPSHYIHIGGDECPKKAWKRCAHCQKLIQDEGLKNEAELQSWFIHRIEKFVNSKGREIIGWDEILEGGLAPNATVMSWRGEKGGIESARQGHKVVMTPGSTCYFDHYQEDPEYAPLAIGSYLPLDSVYHYNPIPDELNEDEQKYIIGVQANLWGEYIQTYSYLEYMAFPRLLAMAEVQWTNPEQKNYLSFTHRLEKEFLRLDYREVNACRNFFNVSFDGAWNNSTASYEVSLNKFCPDSQIYYSLNDSIITPTSSTLYKAPFKLDDEAVVYAALFRDDTQLGAVTRKKFVPHKAVGALYRSVPKPTDEQMNEGYGLTDGLDGYTTDFRRWVIYESDEATITLQLNAPHVIKEVEVASIWRPWNRLWPISEILVYCSDSNSNYHLVAKKNMLHELNSRAGLRCVEKVEFTPTKTQFVKLKLTHYGKIPQGYYSEGEAAYFGLDEIKIN